MLILVKLDSELKVKHPKILGFSSQLKAGKGLTMVASVLQGTYEDRFADAQAAKQVQREAVLTTRTLRHLCIFKVHIANNEEGQGQRVCRSTMLYRHQSRTQPFVSDVTFYV